MDEKEIVTEEKSDLEIARENGEITTGILEVLEDGFGFLRSDNYLPGNKDIYVSQTQVRRFNLNTGDKVKGIARFTSSPQNKFPSLIYVDNINDERIEISLKRKSSQSPRSGGVP